MGCPDWPRCFGSWIPPTSVDQLPADYKERYASIREKKNVKFARYLSAIGFEDTANRILTDKSILVESDFNPVKSWIEYFNRLVGVTIGFFIIAVAWQSRKFVKKRPSLFWISLTTLVAVIFQGWFGSIVVSTNLTPWTITVHMFLALAIVLLLVILYEQTAAPSAVPHDWGLTLLAAAAIVTLLLQVFFGTEVRSAIDRISASFPRPEWLSEVGFDFLRHRAFSWTVLLVHFALIAGIRKRVGLDFLRPLLLVLFLGTFLSGAGMSWWGVPAFLQPIHLLFATLMFGTEVVIFLRLMPARRIAVQPV
jgi:cytochrome c oxidase assembly protein subunit 15